MNEQCPICGQQLPDSGEAWVHFHEAHANQPTTGSPRPPLEPPLPPTPRRVGNGGILRQSYANAPATTIVIAATILVYTFHYLLLKTTGIDTDATLSGNGYMGTDGQWWRLVTPVVVHFGIAHIAFNMAWTYQLGPPIERILGKAGFLLSYLGSAVAGDICSDAVYWHQSIMSGGASGAVYGLGGVLIGAWLTAKALAKRSIGPPPPRAILFNDQAVRSLAILFGAYLLITLTVLRGIDTAAHFGGGLFGLLVGVGVAWRHNRPVAESPV